MERTNVSVEDEDIAKLSRVQDFDVLVSRVFIKHNFIDIVLYEPTISRRPVPVHLSPSLQCREPDIKTHTHNNLFISTQQSSNTGHIYGGAEYWKMHNRMIKTWTV